MKQVAQVREGPRTLDVLFAGYASILPLLVLTISNGNVATVVGCRPPIAFRVRIIDCLVEKTVSRGDWQSIAVIVLLVCCYF